MTLEKYLGDREVWQNNTIEEIKKKVIYKPTSLRNNRVGEKLVAIYGPPQIGKTTLILSLLGITPDYQRKVYNDIRAGVPRGNSSTSTAIIYQQIDADLYGIKYGEYDGNIELCTDTELQKKIREVRQKVEDDSASKEILHIYIPQKYFSEIAGNKMGLNIVDLPGDGSRNIKEKSHVEAIINKYMALATVNIIACKANEIQSLETLHLPIHVDWKNLPHKYVVVITNSYGLGTIRKFFKTKRESRKQNFYEFVSQSYRRDIQEIIGNLSGIEAFPIDIGDSYEKVLYSCGLDENDQNSVIEARSKVLEEIRNSIHQRKGNSLKSTMLDLKAYTTDYAKNQCDDLRGKLNKLLEEKEILKEDNIKENKRISECDMRISELEVYDSKYMELCRSIVKINVQLVIESIEKVIVRYSKKGKIKDSNHTFIGEIREILVTLIQDEINRYELSDDESENETLYEKINMNIDFESTVGDKLYKRGLFGKTTKQVDFEYLMTDLIEDFAVQIKKEIIEKIDIQKRAIKDKFDEYFCFNQWKIESKRDITNNLERITFIDNEIGILKEEIETIEERREGDKKIIDDYLRIADKEFNKYKNNLLEILDLDNILAEEKVIILIYLCIIEKDFQSISEMG